MRLQLKAVFDHRNKARQALHRFAGAGYASADDLVRPPGASQADDAGAAPEWREGPDTSDLEASTAYRFARTLHENDRFRNRSWNEAIGDLKVLWRARDPAGPDWESTEPALHLGWDSTSPEIDDDSYRRSHWNTSYANNAPRVHGGHAKGTSDTAAMEREEWNRKHPGELTPWANFMDAVKHGWERIRIGNDMDETEYRLHHAKTYPGTSYDDFAPVYRYGNNVRRRRAYQGRSWEAAESALRAEWELGHREGKPSNWDEMKAALRKGWDRTQA